MTKLEKLCINWLNENYSHMVPFIMKEYPDYIFHMKDGKCILQHNIKNGYVYVSYRDIWKFFEDYFSMDYEQIQSITKIWVEEHYKMGVTSTQVKLFYSALEVEEHYKMGVTSTVGGLLMKFYGVEEHYKMGVTSTRSFDEKLVDEVEEHYKMGVTSTTEQFLFLPHGVEEHYKMDVTTTGNFYDGIVHKVEEIYKTNITTTKDQNDFYFNRDVEELYNQHTNG